MKANVLKIYFFVIVVVCFTSCATQKYNNTIVGVDYNKKKNITNYFVIPYGNVSLPGKWDKTKYNPKSKQQFFKNKDNISISISFARYDKYEFNANGSLKGYEFIKNFYEWDSKYFVDTYKLQREIILEDSIKNFIIYKIFGENVNTYFLIGNKNGNISNFNISRTDEWDENKKINFLKNLFLTSK